MTEHLIVTVILWSLAISAMALVVGAIGASTIITLRHLWELVQKEWARGNKA
jgi:hypothetical protein